MKKTTIPLIVALCIFLTPFNSVFAAATLSPSTSYLSPQNPSYAVDGNTSTYMRMSPRSWIYFNLSTPSDIRSLTVTSPDSTGSVSVSYILRSTSSQDDVDGAIDLNSTINVYKDDTTRIRIANFTDNWVNVGEIMFSVEGEIIHGEVSNVQVKTENNGAAISWAIPSNNPDFVGSKIYRNGELLKTVDKNTTSYNDLNLTPGNYTYKVTSIYSDQFESTGISKTITVQKIYTELKSLEISVENMDANISWVSPTTDTDFIGVNIYRNGELLTKVSRTTTTYKDIDLTPGDYTYKITASYKDQHETEGISKNVTVTKPLEVAPEVMNLSIKATYKSVDLSWKLPSSDNLQHVNIYRETISNDTSFLEELINGKKAYAASEKIFETNGTYFNDFTVEQEKTYEYTVTTTSIDGVESEGITRVVKVPIEPKINLENLNIPFTVKELIESGNGLILFVAPVLLLALAFLIVPKLRRLIFSSIKKENTQKDETTRRFMQDQERLKERQERQEKKGVLILERQAAAKPVVEAAARTREPKLPRLRVSSIDREQRTPRETRNSNRKPRTPRGER